MGSEMCIRDRLLTWLALNIVARYECVYNHNSKNYKDKHKKSNSWEKSARNLIDYFESKSDVSFGFEAEVVVALGLKEEINLLGAKFPPGCPPSCLL